MTPYRPLDHTGDVAVEVTADDLNGLFAEAMRAMIDCITEVDAVRRASRRVVALSAPAADLLLVDWLAEGLYLFETERWLAARARLAIEAGADGLLLRGELEGETHDPARHPHKVAIKAVTYHALEVGPAAEGWRARVIFDI